MEVQLLNRLSVTSIVSLLRDHLPCLWRHYLDVVTFFFCLVLFILQAVDSKLIPRIKVALDNPLALGLEDELVEQAQSMIGRVEGASVAGAFQSWQRGGRRGGRSWLNNPQVPAPPIYWFSQCVCCSGSGAGSKPLLTGLGVFIKGLLSSNL